MKQRHVNFKVTKCGTFIDPDHPILHATPDFCVNVTVVVSVAVKSSAHIASKELTLMIIVRKSLRVFNQMVKTLYYRGNTLIIIKFNNS